MMRAFTSRDSGVSRPSAPTAPYHHIVNLEVISEGRPDRHRLVQRVDKLLARVPASSVRHLSGIHGGLRVVVAGLSHIELVRLH
jgi:hypothetical protein